MQRRDFFLNGVRGSRGCLSGVLPRSFAWRSSFEGDPHLALRLLDAWLTNREFRDGLMVECRHAAWKVRNARGCGWWEFDASLRLLLETAHLLLWAGERRRDVLAWIGCLGHGCNCDGCDLWNGARWNA